MNTTGEWVVLSETVKKAFGTVNFSIKHQVMAAEAFKKSVDLHFNALVNTVQKKEVEHFFAKAQQAQNEVKKVKKA